MQNIKKIISENLNKLIIYHGMMAGELGELCGLTQRTIATILDHENSEWTPSISTILVLANYFKINIYYFFIEDMTPVMMNDRDFSELIACYIQAPVSVQKKVLRICKTKSHCFSTNDVQRYTKKTSN